MSPPMALKSSKILYIIENYSKILLEAVIFSCLSLSNKMQILYYVDMGGLRNAKNIKKLTYHP